VDALHPPAVLPALACLARGPAAAGEGGALQARAILRGLLRELILARLRRWLGPAPVPRLVELGCGRGAWALRYLALAERVVGVEPDPRLVVVARRAAWQARTGGRAIFLRLGLEQFTHYQGARLVCLGRPLQAFPEVELSRLLERVVAALGPGGRLYLRARLSSALVRRGAPGLARGALLTHLDALGLALEDEFFAAALLPGAALDELGRLPLELVPRLTADFWESLPGERPGGKDCHLLLRVRTVARPALALAG
jgi:SAM-dependent methyltransferase